MWQSANLQDEEEHVDVGNSRDSSPDAGPGRSLPLPNHDDQIVAQWSDQPETLQPRQPQSPCYLTLEACDQYDRHEDLEPQSMAPHTHPQANPDAHTHPEDGADKENHTDAIGTHPHHKGERQTDPMETHHVGPTEGQPFWLNCTGDPTDILMEKQTSITEAADQVAKPVLHGDWIAETAAGTADQDRQGEQEPLYDWYNDTMTAMTPPRWHREPLRETMDRTNPSSTHEEEHEDSNHNSKCRPTDTFNTDIWDTTNPKPGPAPAKPLRRSNRSKVRMENWE